MKPEVKITNGTIRTSLTRSDTACGTMGELTTFMFANNYIFPKKNLFDLCEGSYYILVILFSDC